MIHIILWLIALIISLFFLVKSSDYFTESAEEIGLIAGLSPYIVGATIVAIGTSLPELISSIIAVLRGSSEIVMGDVVGSNIANICMGLGVAIIVAKRIKIKRDLIDTDIPVFLSATFLLALTVADLEFTFVETIIFLAALLVYILFTVSPNNSGVLSPKLEKKEIDKYKHAKIWKPLVILIISAAFLFGSANFTITSVISLSKLLGIGTEVIALTAIAIGTSLPELFVMLSAVRKGRNEMAIGNVIGSNIFNILGVTGISALFGKLVIPPSILVFALPTFVVVSILYAFISQDRVFNKWEGWFLVLFYVYFIFKILGLT